MPEPKYTQEEMDMYCAWADYRSEYGAYGIEAHNEFVNGWIAGRNDHTVEIAMATVDFKAGYDAYWGRLDIGGVMR